MDKKKRKEGFEGVNREPGHQEYFYFRFLFYVDVLILTLMLPLLVAA